MKYAYVMGDLHGNYPALLEVFEKSDYKSGDLVIHLGDTVDGPDNRKFKECVEFLWNLPNCIAIRGNHDQWFFDFLESKNSHIPKIWYDQGGRETLWSYGYSEYDMDKSVVPGTHKAFFETQVYSYVDWDGILFVHGGLPNPSDKVEDVANFDLMWDRQITSWAKKKPAQHYKHVFCGHTTTELIGNTTEPLTHNNVTFLDTGAGWRGKLTLAKIDLETGDIIEYWQA